MKKFLIINSTILPEVFTKVLEAKEMIRLNSGKGISDVVKEVGISRSTFYKYKDYVFSLSEGMVGSKAILSFLLKDEKGILSSVLKLLSDNGANILTINQDIPINKIANASVTIEVSGLTLEVYDLVEKIEKNSVD